MQRLATADALLAVAHDLRYADLSALYTAIGEGHVSAQSVVAKLVKSAGGVEGAQEDLAETTLLTRAPKPQPVGDSGVVVEGAADVWARLSKCCTPVPGDSIVGYISLGRGITIHREDCPNVKALRRSPERFTSVTWDGATTSTSFRVQIAVDSWDRPRLLEDVARTFAEHGSNIVSYGGTVEDQMARNWYVAEVGDVKALRGLLTALRNIDGVFDARRVTPS